MTGSDIITSAKEVRFYLAFVCPEMKSAYATYILLVHFCPQQRGVSLLPTRRGEPLKLKLGIEKLSLKKRNISLLYGEWIFISI